AQIVGGQVKPTLSGDVTVSQARIPFAAILHAAGGGAEAPAATGPQFDLGFDLRARVGKDVRVRSANIDVGTTGQLALTGSLRAPRLAGTLSATQGGVLSTYQRAFRIQHATVTFDPSQGIVPNIDLRAVAHVSNPDPDPDRNAIGSADISVSVTGPADGYAITFASDPPYPQAQILGLLAGAPLLGAVNFNSQETPGLLRGAPGESNVLLPPGVTPYQTGSYTFGQEAFSLFSAQVTQRVFSPVERFFGDALGLDDVGLTVDYGGRLGYTVRRVLSQHSNLAVNFAQVISYPTRTQVGFDLRPDAATSSSFTYFWQPYAPAILFGNPNNTYNYSGAVLSGLQPLSDRQGFRFVVTRRYW
ncbi:MAG: translocation/assembly module TamB domain-containing protein, partial [Candidatus Eremiobacteraeota bacterium]|nr:translocation/assembly module TamB domain-containing protein [Candidatus Eremiobacteraeota bacterium]